MFIIVNVHDNDKYNNITETKLEEFVAKFLKRAMNTCMNKTDSGEPGHSLEQWIDTEL